MPDNEKALNLSISTAADASSAIALGLVIIYVLTQICIHLRLESDIAGMPSWGWFLGGGRVYALIFVYSGK